MLQNAISTFENQKSIKLKARKIDLESQKSENGTEKETKKETNNNSDSLNHEQAAVLKPLVTSSHHIFERSATKSLLTDSGQKPLLDTKPEIPEKFSFNLEEIQLQNQKHHFDHAAAQTHCIF